MSPVYRSLRQTQQDIRPCMTPASTILVDSVVFALLPCVYSVMTSDVTGKPVTVRLFLSMFVGLVHRL